MNAKKDSVTPLTMPEWPSRQTARPARAQFNVGKYEVIAQPIPSSAHMLRYTVFLNGRRIGAMASVPSESDCNHLEKPPVVPPLKRYQAYYRPGRPKKGAVPHAATDAGLGIDRKELPAGLLFIAPEKSEDG
jgi:hypothetical protein